MSSFDLTDRVAVITGATGVLGGVMAKGLAARGVKVAVLGRNADNAAAVAHDIVAAGGQALATPADVLEQAALQHVRDDVLAKWGRIDILINAAGGNLPGATLQPGASFFDLEQQPMRQVMDLNFMGTALPIRVFGAVMGQQASGNIINVSSMTAMKAVTRVVGYSAAKAAIDNLTRWLAQEMGHRYKGGVRVNAMAPGFFVGNQNRALLLNEDGSLTQRGQQIIDHTPLGRFGEPEELLGTAIWLCSDASKFVTGVVVPIDGGFSVASGV